MLQAPLDSNLQKQGLASRSECANWGTGGRRFKSGRPDKHAIGAGQRPVADLLGADPNRTTESRASGDSAEAVQSNEL
jgi:hypothetical protein